MTDWFFSPTGITGGFEGGIWLQFIDGWTDWPGVMSARDSEGDSTPSPEAEMLARELMQNFGDSVKDQQKVFLEEGTNEVHPLIEFHFMTLSGPAKQSVVEAMKLDTLRDRFKLISESAAADTFRIDSSDYLNSRGGRRS